MTKTNHTTISQFPGCHPGKQELRGSLGNFNKSSSLVMHIDLNSCFATVEQQSRPLLRGRPVAVVNRTSTNAAIVTASYEAKRRGIKTGMRLVEARALLPDLVAVETDPPKYHFVYQKLLAILRSYSPNVEMKSIDEGVIDFSDTFRTINNRPLEQIGQEIKARLRGEIGCFMTCNAGIGPNRFLAKTAAGLHKPDGLDEINHNNIHQIFSDLKLTDLTGIAERNQARLNAVGIMTPLDFLAATQETLSRLVFKGKPGQAWFQRLRGWEVDAAPTKLGIIGRQYVLERSDLSRQDILRRLHFLCQSTASKLRHKNKQARGVLIFAAPRDGGKSWMQRCLSPEPVFSAEQIYIKARQLFTAAPAAGDIRTIGVSCYHLSDSDDSQPHLWDIPFSRDRQIVTTIDSIHERYGASAIQVADTLGLEKYMKQKIPFGSTQYFEML